MLVVLYFRRRLAFCQLVPYFFNAWHPSPITAALPKLVVTTWSRDSMAVTVVPRASSLSSFLPWILFALVLNVSLSFGKPKTRSRESGLPDHSLNKIYFSCQARILQDLPAVWLLHP